MQPKVELSQVRSTGEIIDDSILFFKQNWKPLLKCYFVICGFFWLTGLVVSILNQSKTFELQAQGESIFSLTYFLSIFFTFINFVFITLTVLSFVAISKEKGGGIPTTEEVWGYFKYYLLRVLTSSVLLAILLAAGTLICILPGVYLLPAFLLVIAVMVFENASFAYALRRAFQLIKNNWWTTFGTLIVMCIIVCAVMLLLAVPITIVAGLILFASNINHELAQSIAIAIVLNSSQVLYLLPVIAMALTYFNLNERKDDANIMQRIEMLGKHTTNTDHLPTEEY